jgi:class 3 adenylate cyclase
MRLIRLVKLFRKKTGDNDLKKQVSAPGDDWDDEDIQIHVNESAVSKKLSEMTTRRVIMLVLSILLILPFFQADMYKDPMASSAQYGIDSLYRRFHEDMTKFKPYQSQAERDAYLTSLDRTNYVNDFLLYTYFHNWYCKDIPSDAANSPDTSFGKIFWVGGNPVSSPEGQFLLPGPSTPAGTNWNEDWNGQDWALYLCDMPPEAQATLRTPWANATACLEGTIRGISVITPEDSRVECPSDLRYQERIVVSPTVSATETGQFFFMFVFDRRSGSSMDAALNSGQTIFICMLLGLGAMTFSQDANKLVLAPIERMITKLDKIRENPIAAMSIGDDPKEESLVDRFSMRNTMSNSFKSSVSRMTASLGTASAQMGLKQQTQCCRKLVNRVKSFCANLRPRQKDTPEPMETVVLEKTIIKIGSLLALGFGEAGAEIIGENMRGSDTANLNAMLAGKRVEGIFCYCDIRSFAEATEALEDQVMVFVNRIAGVVHTVINEFFGSPNQNIGDAFLLVWKLTGYTESQRQRLCDCAAISIIKVVAAIGKSPLLAEYRTHPKLLKRLPNYQVRTGFGLHTGWAIEGAIGSEFKIDASYLSPNVNMASRLQTFTKIYGCDAILSEMLVKTLSVPVAKLCRCIDRVQVIDAEVTEPFKLYTIDMDDSLLNITPLKEKAKERMRARYERQKRRTTRWQEDFKMSLFVLEDEDIVTMRSRFTSTFFSRFQEALFDYENGKWEQAYKGFEKTRFYTEGIEDGPSVALMRFLKHNNRQAPQDWSGYHIYKNV